MLVVDLHPLEAIDVLNFVDDVTRKRLNSQQSKNVVRVSRAVDDQFTHVDHLTVVHQDVLFFGDQELVRIAIRVRDHETLLTLRILAKRYRPSDFRQHARVFGRTGLEQLGHARQTPRNVPGLLRLLGYSRQHLSGAHFLAVAHRNQRAHRESDRHRVLRIGDLDLVALRIEQSDLWSHGLNRSATFRIDHHERRQSRDFVDLLGHSGPFLDVLEPDPAGVLGNDRTCQRIPSGNGGASLDGATRLDRQNCTIRHLVTFTFTSRVIDNQDLARSANHDLLAFCVVHQPELFGQSDIPVGLRFNRIGHRGARSRATDVEGPHGELRTRLTDRLSGDDTDGFARVNQYAAAEVATVTLGTQSIAGIAGERRTHADLVNALRIDQFHRIFVEQSAVFKHRFLGFRIHHIGCRHATQNTITQGFDDLTTLDQRPHGDAVRGAAIVDDDHEVLGHIHQSAGQVTRVCSLQCGIGQALSCAVRRDEVLQHVQAFAEVGRDRGLDDRTVRLGHQSAHSRKLANLRRRTSRTRVGHHVDRVKRLLLLDLAFAILHRLALQLLHHGLADVIARFAPDVDHLVVALALRDQARDVLLFDFFHLRFSFGKNPDLARWDQHIVNGDRDTPAGRKPKPRLHQAVDKNHRLTQAALAK